MRSTNEKTLKEAIQQLLEVYHLKDKFTEVDIIHNWENIMGKMIANRTSEVFIKNKKLFIRLNSAVLKQEFLMMKANVLNKVNEHAGVVVAEELILL